MNAYARSLPALGFDPAPGDVGLTRSLARQHSLVAQEARQVLALLERLNLSVMQRRAADALRAVQDMFPPALRNAASAADSLQAAASSWADQLSAFQAEADALERQAAAPTVHQQAVLARQATLPTGSLLLTDDLQAASASVSGIHGQAQELHQRYLAAARQPQASRSIQGCGRTPSRAVNGVSEKVEEIEKLKSAGKPITEELIEAGRLAESTGEKYAAWHAFAPGWLKTAAGSIAEIRGLSYTLSGLGLAADVGTVISPQNHGALGTADRVVGISNGLLITGDLILDGLPGIGEVALAATGAYLAGDYLYQHWTPFRDVANDVGHATVRAADDVGHTADSAWHKVTSFENTLTSIGSLF